MAGEDAGVSGDRFWEDLEMLAQVARVAKYDALLVPTIERRKRRYYINVKVYNACYGEFTGEVEVKLGKKARLGSNDQEELRNQLNETIALTRCDWEPPKTEAFITVHTQPEGAEILRDGQSLGQTPLETAVPLGEGSEMWEVMYQGQPAGMLKVDISQDGSYEHIIPPEIAGTPEQEEDSGAGMPMGTARSILDLHAGVVVGIRSLAVSVVEGVPLDYDSAAYPIFNLDLAFYPFPLFSSNEYLAGFGVIANGGYGSLDSTIPLIGGRTLPEGSECSGDGTSVTCPTTHTQFQAGATYQLLLQSHPEKAGYLDPNGIAINLDILYSWLVFDVASNPTYEGHGYQGLNVELGFSTPLVLPELRAKIQGGYIHLVGFGDAEMIEDWGLTATGLGGTFEVGLSYEFWAGLYGALGYEATFFQTTYDGVGCQDEACTLPTGSIADDVYHRIAVQLGYRLH